MSRGLKGVFLHSNLRLLIRDFVVAIVCIYGYVYAAFKLGNPSFLARDFFFYKDMVGRPFDFAATQAPYALRQTPALIATLFYNLKVNYGGETVLDLAGFDADTKLRYFAFVLSNGFAACLTLIILSAYVRRKTGRQDLTLFFTLFGILSAWFWFSTLAIAPLAVAWGWLVSTVFGIAFIERSIRITGLAALLAIFTRETTLIFTLAMFSCAMALDRKAIRTLLAPTAVIALACILYFGLRLALTHGGERQLAGGQIVAAYADFHTMPGFIAQSILSQGLIAVLLIAIGLKAYRPACWLLAGIAAVSLVGVGVRITQLSHVTGETLPIFALFYILGQHLWLDTHSATNFSPSTNGPNPSET